MQEQGQQVYVERVDGDLGPEGDVGNPRQCLVLGISVQPNRIYSSDELRLLIYGKVKIQRLRDHGLHSVGRGYLGADILAALASISETKRERSIKDLKEGKNNEKRKSAAKRNDPRRRLDNPAKEPERQIESNRKRRHFTLHQIGTPTWRFIFGRSSDGSQKRKQLDAVGVEEAALKTIECLFGRSATTVNPRWDIADVLRHGWEESNSEPYHRQHLKEWADYFFEWCLGEEIYYWEDLIEKKTPGDYVASLVERKMQRKSIGHYLEPLKTASKWAANKSRGRLEDWFAGFRLPPKTGVELKYEKKKRLSYLSIPKVLDLLEWLRCYHQGLSLRPGVALQALCALSLQEATGLTWDRVDLICRTITIEEDRRHNPRMAGVKNRWRVRKLPLPDLVHAILVETYHRQGCPSGSALVIDAPSWKAYSNRFYHMFKAWDPKARIPPSDFRNTLPNTAEDGKWMSVWFRRFFGHAPANEIEKSYLAIQSEKGLDEGTDQFVEKLRAEVVRHIEHEIEEWIASSENKRVIRLERGAA